MAKLSIPFLSGGRGTPSLGVEKPETRNVSSSLPYPGFGPGSNDLAAYNYAVHRLGPIYYGPWSPLQWKLMWLSDAYVLGKLGIYPKLSTEGFENWKTHKVDLEGRLDYRDFQRIILGAIVVDGESFIRRQEGRLVPMTPPTEIRYDPNTRMVVSYRWQYPINLVLTPEEVIHLFIQVWPGQRRGVNLFSLVYDVADERRNFIRAIVKQAKMLARMWLFHKKFAGNPLVDRDMTPDEAKKAEVSTINFDEDGVTEIGPKDEIISTPVTGTVVSPMELEKVVGQYIAQPFNISRMSLLGDYSDASYSSARFASIIDNATWEKYQKIIEEISRALYELWPGRAIYGDSFNGWVTPMFPHIDPQKTATTNKVMEVDMGSKSVQQCIRENNRDPEETFLEIEEYKRAVPQGGPGWCFRNSHPARRGYSRRPRCYPCRSSSDIRKGPHP